MGVTEEIARKRQLSPERDSSRVIGDHKRDPVDRTYFSEDSLSTYDVDKTKTNISSVKNDVLNVIELMGPSTPHIESSVSNVGFKDLQNDKNIMTTSTLSTERSDYQASDNTTQSIPSIKEDTINVSIMAVKNSPGIPMNIDFHNPLDRPSHLPSAPPLPRRQKCEYCVCENCPKTMIHPRGISPPPCYRSCNCNLEYGCMAEAANMTNQIHLRSAGDATAFKGKRTLQEWIKVKLLNPILKNACGDQDVYKINLKHSKLDQQKPKRLVFDLVENPKGKGVNFGVQVDDEYNFPLNMCQSGIKAKPCPMSGNFCTNTEGYCPSKDYCGQVEGRTSYFDLNNRTRVDIYYFDHGNSTFYKTTDRPPAIVTEIIAEKTEAYTTRFWAEIFGSFHIGFSFCTAFILQFLRFVLYSLVRPLTVGLIQLWSDYFFKPCLATIFNAIIQPPLIFIYNVLTSLRDLLEPIAEGLGFFFRELAVLVGAFRLVEVYKKCEIGNGNRNGNESGNGLKPNKKSADVEK